MFAKDRTANEHFGLFSSMFLWVYGVCSPLAGYLADRVTAIRKTAVYAPRYVRRMVSGIRVLGWKEGMLEVRANYLALETLQDELTRVFNTGQYRDKLVVEDGRLKFKEKLCIFDSLLVPSSLIYPL